MARYVQVEDHAGADLEAAIAIRLEWHRAEREARRRLDAEEEDADNLDGLYLDRGQLDQLTAPPALIPGVLPRHSYAIVRGRDATFKSFTVLDWGLCLATGQPWNLAPVESVPVLYIAGEGAWGLRSRVAAWETARGVTVDPARFTVRQAALNMYRPGPAFDHLLEHVEGRGYGLVIVDTLRRVSGAADGNSSEMGAVVDSLDRLKLATAGGTVLTVAHTGKSDDDSRGFSGIEDDADVVWHAKRTEGTNRVSLELTKCKDGPDGTVLHLAAMPVGDSLVLNPTTAPVMPTRPAATPNEAQLLETLSTFPDGLATADLMKASGLSRPTFYRARKALEDRGELVEKQAQGALVWVTQSHGQSHAESHVSQGVSPLDTPPDLRSLTASHGVSASLLPVSPVSRPLGSETLRRDPETPQPGESTHVGGSAPGGLTPEQLAILSPSDATPADDTGVTP